MLTITRGCFVCNTQVCSSKVKVILRGKRSKVGPLFHVPSITLPFLDGFSNDLAEMLTTMSRCVTGKTQVYSSNVKVLLRGQRLKKGFILRVTLSSLMGGEVTCTLQKCLLS